MPPKTTTTRGADSDTVHVVVLLHGIRTRAFWYDLVQPPILSEIPNIEVKPLGYDYFSALRLVVPFFRGGPAQKIVADIEDIKSRYDRQNKRVRLSVIAHSFGTYTIVRVLRKTRDIDIHHLVLCGSVLPRSSDFDSISRKIHGKFVNDAGQRISGRSWPRSPPSDTAYPARSAFRADCSRTASTTSSIPISSTRRSCASTGFRSSIVWTSRLRDFLPKTLKGVCPTLLQ